MAQLHACNNALMLSVLQLQFSSAGRTENVFRVCRHCATVQRTAARPGAFHQVHGGVCALDQCGAITAVVGVDADANAGLQRRRWRTGQRQRRQPRQSASDFFSHGHGVFSRCNASQQHQKFITAVAADRVDCAHSVGQAAGG